MSGEEDEVIMDVEDPVMEDAYVENPVMEEVYEGGYTEEAYNGAAFNEDGVYTEVEHESFFERLGNSFAGICIGLILFVGAFPLLWWNEGRAVDTYLAISEGRKIFVPIDASSINPVNEGALVYVTGLAEPTENLTDTFFGLEVASKTRLQRSVELYQWVENKSTRKEKNLGGGTTTVTEYTYDKQWRTSLIDSSKFKKPTNHQNPQSMPYSSQSFLSNVILGAFSLPDDMVGQISSLVPLGESLSTDIIPADNLLAQSYNEQTYPNGFYFGSSSTSPSVGDSRVTYEVASGGTVSVLAMQSGSSFVPYEASSGGNLYRLSQGTVSAEKMFDNAKAENKTVTMILRIVGAIVMSTGIGMLLQPLAIVADIVPCIGDMVGGAISCVAGTIGIVLSLIVIGIAWVANRPVILGVACAGVAVVGFLVYSGYKRKQSKAIEKDSDSGHTSDS